MLSQPRWNDSAERAGLLNVTISEMTSDAPDGVKQRILDECNACAINGHASGLEYATLMHAETGAPIVGCRLLQGTEDRVSISPWLSALSKAPALSLALIHNHTIISLPSDDDIEVFLSHSSLKDMFVTIGGRLYYIQKTERSICDYAVAKKLFYQAFSGGNARNAYGGADFEKMYVAYEAVLGAMGINFGRW